MDAVLKFCEENDIDTASVGPLINKSLKEKLQLEAEKLNFQYDRLQQQDQQADNRLDIAERKLEKN